ncbi:MAG: hypothetical protein Q7R96_01945 [Nanoarchaeota archaeon]|nr:hypothetical protein [Nanoarchaeota archaeon]
MPDNIKFLSKHLAERPIKIPGSPFWTVFKRFGIDELIAMIINILGTVIMSLFFTHPLLLSITGPIVEKIGFFVAHLKEAISIYKTTAHNKRKHLSFYLKDAFKHGMKSLIEDILIHDPLYIIFMFFGLLIYPATPVWLLSATSFIVAVFAVSGLEVLYTELQYKRFKRHMIKKGFHLESYYESRFFISAKENPKKVIDKVVQTFNLSTTKNLTYNDKYFGTTLARYSGRIPKIRLRQRTNSRTKGWIQTAQIIYTRPNETANTQYEQYRYFPIRKEKLYYVLEKNMPKNLQEISQETIRKSLLTAYDQSKPKRVNFVRTFAHDKELLISVDKINKTRDFYVLELKVYTDIKLLIEAMRYVMREFPVVQTTDGKADMNL